MAYTLQIQGSISLLTNNQNKNQYFLNDSLTLAGTTYVDETPNITGSAWYACKTGSLSNTKVAYFYNNDNSASITIATGSAGQNVLGILTPGDSMLFRWNGLTNVPLYAQPNGSRSVSLTYFITSS